MKYSKVITLVLFSIYSIASAGKITFSPSLRVWTNNTGVAYKPTFSDKPIIEWAFDSTAYELVDHYEIYELTKSWQKIGVVKKDTNFYVLKGKYEADKKYTFKITCVLKNKEVFESNSTEYQHVVNPCEPITSIKTDFVEINGKRYFHVVWESPKNYIAEGSEALVLFESPFEAGRYGTYPNDLKKANEEYFELYPHMKGKKLNFYILTKKDFVWAKPSPQFSFVAE